MNNQVKQQIDKETFVNFLKSEITNWNGCYDMYTSVRVDTLQWVIDRIENNNAQVGLIDTPPVPTIKPGDKVRHEERGKGTVLWVLSDHASVQFNDVIKICKIRDLEVVE